LNLLANTEKHLSALSEDKMINPFILEENRLSGKTDISIDSSDRIK